MRRRCRTVAWSPGVFNVSLSSVQAAVWRGELVSYPSSNGQQHYSAEAVTKATHTQISFHSQARARKLIGAIDTLGREQIF